MKSPSRTWFAIALFAPVLVGWSPAPASAADASAAQALAATQQSLRQEGFKTDLADFDFSTSPELREREAILTNAVRIRFDWPGRDHPNLMQAVGDNSAIVAWKLDSLEKQIRARPNEAGRLSWEEFRNTVTANQSWDDPAAAAVLSGPIRFDFNAQEGANLLLPQLARMRNLAWTFGDRALLAVHDGQPAVAWTNLLAATRLASAWEPEPMEMSHLVRFACTASAYNAIWQALQTNGWTAEQLAALQHEWESVDYFRNLPETAAFQRASSAAACERERSGEDDPKPAFGEFVRTAIQYPGSVWDELQDRRNQALRRRRGNFDDEKALLLFYRDREVELRQAVKAPTWAAMRQLPGVTNIARFQSPSHLRLQTLMDLRETSRGLQLQGGMLGRAATAESQRRIIIAALALEQYRNRHGSYPTALAELAPEFLKTAPVDFMDGQPLRYRLNGNGHFLLYSVGLDCVDNGGRMRKNFPDPRFQRPAYPGAPLPEFDIVWPLPATAAAIAASEQEQKDAQQKRAEDLEQLQSTTRWNQTAARQKQAAALLQTTPSPAPDNRMFRKILLADYLHNPDTTTNKLSLTQLLALTPVPTGEEPEIVTFEVPMRFEALTNVGNLSLFVDRGTDQGLDSVLSEGITEISRATNGDCRIRWSTIYEAPGLHAVQASLEMASATGQDGYANDQDMVFGPMAAVTLTNLCQFSLSSANYDPDTGALLHARLAESNGAFAIECLTTNGTHLKTLTGSTTNGEFKVLWNLADDRGNRLHGETFNTVIRITLTDSGRTQTLRGP